MSREKLQAERKSPHARGPILTPAMKEYLLSCARDHALGLCQDVSAIAEQHNLSEGEALKSWELLHKRLKNDWKM